MRVAVVYEVAADHHIQVNEFLFANPAPGESFQLGSAMIPSTRKWDGEPILSGKAPVLFDLTLAADAPLGERTLRLTVGYQQCSESPVFACFQPEEREATLPIRVVAPGTPIQSTHASLFAKTASPDRSEQAPAAGPSAAPPAGGQEPTEGAAEPEGGAGSASPSISASARDSTGEAGAGADGKAAKAGLHDGLAGQLREALARGSWLAFLLVFIAGFLTSFTPCVYPMIPITIGYVAGASRGRLSGFILSLFFVLGIAIVYSSLGIAAALSGGIFGAALQSKAALVVIASVFVLMGASMLGAFDLTLPFGHADAAAVGPTRRLDRGGRHGRDHGTRRIAVRGAGARRPADLGRAGWPPAVRFRAPLHLRARAGRSLPRARSFRRRDEEPPDRRRLDGDGEALLRLDLPRACGLLSPRT